MARRPVIAISGPDRGGLPAWLFTSWAVRVGGGRPVRATPSRPLPRRMDGLILGGGADVSPDHYGGERRPARPRVDRARGRLAVDILIAPLIGGLRRAAGIHPRAAGRPDPARDLMELALIRRAERDGLPVLGICRGAQLLNVHAGGTLHQDLSSFYTERPHRWTVFPRKPIVVAEDSHLREALGRSLATVNSLHWQAIDRLGRGLRVVARDTSLVVQAVEHPDRRFWIGVQWHPEYMPQVPEQRRLLRWVVRAAREAARDAGRSGSGAARAAS